MFRFQHTTYLYAGILLPLAVILFIAFVYWRRKIIAKLGDEFLVADQLRGRISGRYTTKFVLLSIALTAIIIGLANLQAGDKFEKVQRKGVEVIVALDVSKSMLAKDIEPNRLTRAKQLILRLMETMSNDRVGLIVFAGRPYLHVPLTIDYSAVKMMLQNVSPDMVPAQGTVIGDAIDMAMNSFTQIEHKYKSIIVISDGEDHDEKALQKAKEAADAGIIIHTIGVGSPQGATLWDEDTKAPKLDENGNIVVSKLNEEELRSIAGAGNGTYQLLQNGDDVAAKLNASLSGMEQKSLGSYEFTEYISYFQYFLFVGFVILVIEWMLPGAKQKLILK
jgi:Ca-activated chloride channel homolog